MGAWKAMWGFIQQLRRKLRVFFIRGYRSGRFYFQKALPDFKGGISFRFPPGMRRWGIIVGPPAVVFFIVTLIIVIDTPGRNELIKIRNQVASEVYSADSVLLGRYFIQDRTEVDYQDISPAVIDALIATEDVRFFRHSGVDYRSLGRVLIRSILQNDESAGGGSTITQQLAKNLYPRKQYWILPVLLNKLREVRIATRLEKIYSKKELISLYLNTVPFSDNVYGIQSAAQRFYSVPAKDLTVEQGAMLIGTLKATHSYNPRLFPERALNRRNVVLQQMVKYNYLPSAKADSLKKLPVALDYDKAIHQQGLASYFREYVKMELLRWCENNKTEDGSSYNLYTDGLKIYTTLDSKMQQHAEQAMMRQMSDIQKMFQNHWGKEEPWKGREWLVDQALRRSTRYKKLKEQGLAEKEIMRILEKPVPMSLFTWQGPQETTVSPLDSIRHHLKFLNAGFVAMEPKTGKVKAWVGGINHEFFQFDHVKVSTKRQVGSVFKPIVFAMAIEQGVDPCEFMAAERETYTDNEGKEWTPRNAQYDYGVQYSMKGAMAYSVNTVSVKLIEKAGIGNTIRLARKMGISSDIPHVPSIALGSPSISLMEMTAAYACFVNEGVTATPYVINAITDKEGKIFEDFRPLSAGKRAMSQETAALITSMLRTVVHEGTASRLRWKYGVYNDVAGKTGTTQANADGWFIAMTPELVMGSWVGADDPRIRFRSTELGQGSNTALPITAYFMKLINGDAKYATITEAKFPPLPRSLQKRLGCDLYELNDDLWAKVERTIFQRDSIMHADTITPPPPESFLQALYKRKVKIMMATRQPVPDEITDATVTEGGGGFE